MAKFIDRARQPTTTTGTGPFALAAAVTGWQAFEDSPDLSDGDSVYCAVAHRTLSQWIAGIATIQFGANTATFTSITASSNDGSAVSFSAGTKDVFSAATAAALTALAGGAGDVVGPGSAVDGHLVKFDGSTGKLIKDGGAAPSGTNTGDQTITLTGDVTGSGTGSFAATIANAAVTLAKMANVATARFFGRITSGSGVPEDLTGTQATTLLDAFVGDSGSGGTKGLVPAPASGDAAANKFLKADGTFAAPSGSGDVVGPSSAVNNRVVTFDGTTGKLIKDSGLTLSGSNTGDQTSVTGNAGTATALQTARNINGTAFDGTANITIMAAASTLTGLGTGVATWLGTPTIANLLSATAAVARNDSAQTFTGVQTFNSQPVMAGNNAGRVAYIGASGVLTDSTNLQWDYTNKKLTVTGGGAGNLVVQGLPSATQFIGIHLQGGVTVSDYNFASGSGLDLLISRSSGTHIVFKEANGSNQFGVYANGNVVVGNAAIATNATNGFFYLNACAGTPTGTPTALASAIPCIIDTTGGKLWAYYGSAWHFALMT